MVEANTEELEGGARSPLSHIAAASSGSGGAQVTLREHALRGFIDLRLDPADAGARAAAEAALGAALPAENRVSAGTGCTILWLGPDEFLAMTAPDAEAALAQSLRQALAAHHASIFEVSDGRTTFEMSGPRTRDLLAKGCGLDLH